MEKPALPLIEPNAISKRRRSLPHWETWDATYFVTFRLNDSLPVSVLARYSDERKSLVRRMQRAEEAERAELQGEIWRLFAHRIGRMLDEGQGECHLAKLGAAPIVTESLKFFDGERYELFAYAVMPNHVHVLVKVPEVGQLEKILHSWKSYTSKRINSLLNRSGPLWQHESFDHLIRRESDFDKCLRYTLDNPANAGLKDWPWVWSAFRESPSLDETLLGRLEAGTTAGGLE